MTIYIKQDNTENLSTIPLLDPYYLKKESKTTKVISLLGTFSVGFMVCLLIMLGIDYFKGSLNKFRGSLDCNKCHSHKAALTNYFKKNGSKTPEEMANALLKTRSPRLLSAIAKVETGGNPTVMRSGFRKQHDGAFQVNPKYWGKVPKDAVGQALQAETILQELVDEYPIKTALSKYGGDSTSKYQKRVLAELTRVP